LLAPLALVVLPGCGGGSSNAPADIIFQRKVGVELINNGDPARPVVFDRGNLTIGVVDSSSSTRTASGTLQLLGSSVILPTATTNPTPSPRLPAAGTVNLQPLPGSYLLTGTANYSASGNVFTIDMRGALEPAIPFTLTGDLSDNGLAVLRAQTRSGTIVIPMRVVAQPFAFTPSGSSPTPTATAIPNGTLTPTPTGTGAPTGMATAFPTATVTATATASPTQTAFPSPTTPSPVGTPPSPVGTPPSPTG